VTYPGSAAYETAQVAYYAQQQIDLEPACRVGPKTAADVAAILKAAVDNKIPFAVHSGGHLTMIGGSNIADEGFSIDLGALNNFKIAKDEKSVTFGTGLRWGQIFPPLAEKGLTAVGGRDPGVGVGGYLAGGKLMSFVMRVQFSRMSIFFQVVSPSCPISMAWEATMSLSTRWP